MRKIYDLARAVREAQALFRWLHNCPAEELMAWHYMQIMAQERLIPPPQQRTGRTCR
jgi:hypothetical protein